MTKPVGLKEATLALVIAMLVSFALGRFTAPARIETKAEIHYVEKLRTVEAEKKDVVATIVEKKKPDGTEIKKTRIVDKTVGSSTTEIDTEGSRIDEVRSVPDVWRLRGLAAYYSGGITYGAGVDRQILGPISLGAWALSNGTVGLSLGISF